MQPTGTAAARPPVLTRGRVTGRTVLVVASFGAFLAFLDATIVNVAFTSIEATFRGSTVSSLSWVLNAYNIVFAAFLVPSGRLADLLGRRRTFVTGVVLFTAASALCAVAGSVGVLVGMRAVQALGAALLVPASLAVVVEAFPAERRTHAVGLWGASAALASGLGPPIGGALVQAGGVDSGGWRWAFLVNVPFGLLAAVAARTTLVESRAPGRRRLPDLAGATAFAGSLGLLTLAITQGHDWGWGSVAVVAAFVGSAALLAGFVLSSRRHPVPLLDAALLRVRPFAVGNLLTVVAGMGFYAYLLTNVLWLQYVWGYGVLRAGLATVPGALVAAVVAGVLGPLAERRGYVVVLVPGALVWAAAYVWYVREVGTTPAFLSEWLPGQLLSGLGVGATLPLAASAALRAVPGGRYATASAFVSSTRQVGAALGIALLVVVIGTPTPVSAAHDFRAGWVFSIICFLAAAVVAAFVGKVRPAADPTAGTSDGASEAGSGLVRLPVPAAAAARERLDPLAAVPMLARLPEAARAGLLEAATSTELPAGQTLFHAGDAADSLYVVRTGRLEVVVDGSVARELGAGAVLGELALLSGGVRSATVRARRDSELLRVSRESFDRVLDADVAAARAVATTLAEQLATARPPAPEGRELPRLVAVVGLHAGAPVEPVADVLAARLREWGTVAVPGPVGPAGLERAEAAADRVVLVAPWAEAASSPDTTSEPAGAGAPPAADWWARCRRQADVVVLVAASDVAPSAEHTVHRGDDPQHAPELVLVGPVDRPVRTAWAHALDPWQVTAADGDLAVALRPLAARLAGRSVGLVLAGGGARAFAHVGVLAELADAGVAVDRVAGASMGAIVAALHAVGHDPATIHDICHEEFVRRRPFSDYTLPRTSLARGRRTRTGMERQLGDVRFEDLPRQLRCVSTDLLERVPHVHRGGLVADAVMASVSLPVLFPPVRSDGRLLVDGGVLDNLPVGALTERPEGPVVAVNISMGAGSRSSARPGPGATEASVPAQRGPRVPALGETLLRTMMIGSGGAVDTARSLGAVVLTPPTLGVGLLEFHQLDRMVEAGRSAARELLAATGPELAAALAVR